MQEDEENKVSQDQKAQEEEAQGEIARTHVGFPEQTPKEGKSKVVLTALIILLLIGVFVGGFSFYRSRQEQEVEITPTPTLQVKPNTPTPTKREVNRQEVKIQILNGSGIPGAARDLKEELGKLGYSEINVGNADKQDYIDTKVIFGDIDSDVKEEILSKLKDIYQNVEPEEDSLNDFDIRIITGHPKGYKPSPTPRPTSTPTPTLTPSTTPGITSTPTPTP